MGGARRRYLKGALALLVTAAAFAPASLAAARPGPGALDPSFGHGGRVLSRSVPEVTPAEFAAPKQAANGDLVLELRRNTHGDGTIREIEMRLPGGALDRAFGDDGRVAVEAGKGLAAMADGDIAVGATRCDGKAAAATMLDPSGSVVRGFGVEGCAPNVGFLETTIAVDANGRLVLAGSRQHCPPCGKDALPTNEIVVARLLADGSGRDPGFGDGGEVAGDDDLSFEPETAGSPTELAGTAGGGLEIAAGVTLFRLDESGALDTGYGKGGVASIDGSPYGFVLEPDGSADVISAGGRPHGVYVTRLDPTGAPVPSFGDAGTVRLGEGEVEAGRIAPAPGGGLFVSGRKDFDRPCQACTERRFLERLTPTGAPDPSFGRRGVVESTSPAPVRIGYADLPELLATPDGSTFVVGANHVHDAAVAAWTPAGRPRRSFGKAGILTAHYAEPAELAPTGMTLDPRGSLTVVNERWTAPGLRSGFLTSFGADGGQRRVGGSGAARTAYHGLTVPLGDKGVVIWEPPESEQTTFVLHTAGPGGAPIASFGEHGEATLPEGMTPWEVVAAPGGGIAVIGVYGKGQMAVYRLGPNGRPLRGFGNHGLARARFPQGGAASYGGVVEADGDVVVTGSIGRRFAAARFLPDGRIDPGFGRHGLVDLGLRTGIGDLVAPWHGGVVIAVVKPDVPHDTSVGLIHLDRDGRLDRAFGHRGIAAAVAEKVPLDLFTGAGRIVVVTDPVFEKGHKGGGVELRSFKPDGSIDRRFGDRGVRFFGAGIDEEHAFTPTAAVQQEDGAVVVAGERQTGRHAQAELVRFLLR
jgi:uncharacterized delta-60 repeat protein